ncbi:tRNA 4-thiouridine(8) synthase ThiI [candidate division KSB1 bacterium]|nr:tRNA 4-thiouridine(8) synthase ThiI [candidate division KSB1 bacterium]RQW02109.1 MAG: tRNA 4-thiouridine(8) synthase ThiI [candidate division KSB1 bacterium]
MPENSLQRVIIIHHSEIALKKRNRPFFESRLRANINRALVDVRGISVQIDYGRFFLPLPDGCDVQRVIDRLRHVIGIASFRIAVRGDPDPEILKDQVLDAITGQEFRSFRVDTHRVDKHYPYTSVQVNQIVGARIQSATGAKVDLGSAEFVIKIDVFNKCVYFALQTYAGERGLPVRSTGKVVSMLSSGIDSPVSSFRMMKRGCQIIFVHFHSYPFTEKSSYYNVLDLIKILTVYQNSSRIYFVSLADIQKEIILTAPAKLRVVMYRRMMFRLAESIARREGAGAIVTGDSLGQVASQTLENIAAISEVVRMPILRPLIGLEKKDIIEMARHIGTFAVSTEPYDDCCSYLLPTKPETKAKLSEVHAVEEKMGAWQSLLDQALASAEIKTIRFP